MSAPPPNHDNPSSRFAFEDSQRPRQKRKRKNRDSYEGETIAEQVLWEVDDALGCSNRLFGCVLSLITLPFRLVWNVIEAVMD